MNTRDHRPSVVLQALLKENPNVTNPQLADLYVEKYPELRGAAKRVIWRWSRTDDGSNPLSSTQVDLLLGEMLAEAGYLL